MKTKIETRGNEPPKYVKEISGDIIAYARLFMGVGILAILASVFFNTFAFAGSFWVLGIAFFIMGILLEILAREFRRLRPWTYPIVKMLVGNPARLDSRLDNFPQKIRSAEVRRAFGLEPLPDAERDDDPKDNSN